MKEICKKLGGLGALLTCIPVIYRINQGDAFNPTSFFLWSMLSLICFIVLYRTKRGGHVLMGGYVFADLSIGLWAYHKSHVVQFGKFEMFIVGMAMACAGLYAWCESRKNFRPAVMTNATALVLAGVPQILDSFAEPFKVSFGVCSVYIAVSALSYYGEEQTLEARLIPGLSIVYWVVIIGGVLIERHQ